MSIFFPKLYPNELVYSGVSRYHFYTGNIDKIDTIEEIFGSRNCRPNKEICTCMGIVNDNISKESSLEDLLQNHTLLSFYAPFMTKERLSIVKKDLENKGSKLVLRTGIAAGSICKNKYFKYCPICAEEDIKKYGEPYIHREHHLQGIDICPHHKFRLREYEDNYLSRVNLIGFEKKNMNLSSLSVLNHYIMMELVIKTFP